MTNKQMSVNIISDDDISDDIIEMLSDTSFLDDISDDIVDMLSDTSFLDTRLL